MLNKGKKEREVLNSSDSARSCKTSDREEEELKSTGVFGGAGLAHGPVLARSTSHPLSFSSAPAGNCQGRC